MGDDDRPLLVGLDLMPRAIDASIDPYDTAVAMGDLARSTVRTDPAGYPLWLIWSSLTDRRRAPPGPDR